MKDKNPKLKKLFSVCREHMPATHTKRIYLDVVAVLSSLKEADSYIRKCANTQAMVVVPTYRLEQ